MKLILATLATATTLAFASGALAQTPCERTCRGQRRSES